MTSNIHSTAIISNDAVIGENVNIGAYTIIEDDVRIGNNCSIGNHATIKSHTYIGNNNIIHDYAMLGNLPQDISFDKNKITHLVIGNGNEFREFCNIHRASADNGKTIIKNNCYIMANGHVAHDCVIEDNVIICNGALVAGYVEVGHNAFISGNVVIHQFCIIGNYVMMGGLSATSQDILPYSLVMDVPASVYKLNIVGLRRAGFSSENIAEVEYAHNLWYNWNSTKAEFIERYKDDNSLSDISKNVVNFIIKSRRGITPKHI